MGYPTDPLKITVQERIVAVLKDIAAGDDFYYSPGAIYDKWVHWKERISYPSYSVVFGSGGTVKMLSGHNCEETFIIVVSGAVETQDGSTQKPLVRCVRDVRKAIYDDMASGADGSLGALVLRCNITQSPVTDEGKYALENYGYFEQEFEFTVQGDIDTI